MTSPSYAGTGAAVVIGEPPERKSVSFIHKFSVQKYSLSANHSARYFSSAETTAESKKQPSLCPPGASI